MAQTTLAGVTFNKPDEFIVREGQAGLASLIRFNVKDKKMEMNLLVGSIFDIAQAATPTKVTLHLPEGQKAQQSDIKTIADMLLAALEADASLESDGVIKNKQRKEGITKKKLTFIQATYVSMPKQDVVQGVTIIFEKDTERAAVLAYRGNIALKQQLEQWNSSILDTLEFTTPAKPKPRYRVNYYATRSSGSYFESDSQWQYDVIDNKTGKVMNSFYESEYGSSAGFTLSGTKDVTISEDEKTLIVTKHDGTVQNISIAQSIAETEKLEREISESMKNARTTPKTKEKK